MYNKIKTFYIKKILFLFLFIFLGVGNSYAIENTYDTPTFLAISGTAESDGSLADNDLIKGNDLSSEQFCIELGGSLISYDISTSQEFVADYVSPQWKISDNQENYITTIICDIPVNSSDNGGLNVNGEPLGSDIPVFVVNQGVVYINKDNFFYMLVASSVILLLFRSVIYIFLTAFHTGKNLASGKGLRVNKK